MNEANSDSKTILMIHPGGLMPVHGGGATRFWSMTEYLCGLGYRIELVTANHGEFNDLISDRVHRLWVQNASGGSQATNSGHKLPIIKRILRRLAKTYTVWDEWTGNAAKWKLPDESTTIDKRRRRGLEELAGRIAYETRPIAAIATFIWMAPALDRMPPGTLRVIDTIDVQHTRADNAKKAGGRLDHCQCDIEDEIRELKRADLLIAIQTEEKKVFESICSGIPVCVVEHSHKVLNTPPDTSSRSGLLFVGNLYDPNVIGLRRFIENVFPKIHQAAPKCELTVCGKVCEAFKNCHYPGVYYKGPVPDLSQYYDEAAVVINPVPYGSGLKIKNVEALSHGKALVTTPQGMVGFPNYESPFCIVTTTDNMAAPILELINDIEKRKYWELMGLEYAKAHFTADCVYRDFSDCLHRLPILPA